MKRLLRGLRLAFYTAGFGLGLLVVVLAWALLTDTGSRRLLQIALVTASGAGSTLEARAIDGNLVDGLQLRGLRFATDDGAMLLEVAELEFAWRPWHLLQGTLQLDLLRIKGLQWRSRSDAAAPQEPFDARVIGEWFALSPLALELARLEARALSFDINGSRFEIPALDFAASLDTRRLQLHELSLVAFDTQVQGALSLDRDLQLLGALEWAWGTAGDYGGNLDVSGSLLDLQVRHALQAPVMVQSEGSIVTGLDAERALQLDLQHRLAALDMAHWGVPDLAFSQLHLSTGGDLQRLTLQLALQAQFRDFAPMALQADALYLPDRIELGLLSVDSDELALQLRGDWAIAAQTLALEWELLRVDLERTSVNLHEVSGTGALDLQLLDAGISARVQLGPLQGQLNDYPLALDGELEILESAPRALSLQARSADNSLSLEGTLAPTLALSWVLDAPRLSRIYAGLGGQLAGSGELRGSLEAPLASGALQGSDLSFVQEGLQLALQGLRLDATSNGTENRVALELTALSLQQQAGSQTLVDSARIGLEGSLARHAMELQASGMDSSLALGLSGQWEDGGWTGSLARAALESPFGPWTLVEPFAITWQAPGLELESHCWSGPPMGLCLGLAGSGSEGFDAQLDLSGLPLDWLNRRGPGSDKPEALQALQTAWSLDLPTGVSLQGGIDLSARVNGLRGGVPASLQAELRGSGLELMFTRELESDAETGQTEVDMQRFFIDAQPVTLALESGQWRAATNLAITQAEDVDDAAVFQGSLDLALSLDAQERLGGAVELAFADLAFVESLVPALQRPQGRLQGTVQLAGTLTEPQIEADISITEAAADLPALGIELRQLGINLRSSNDSVALQAKAASGAGFLQLQADVANPLSAQRVLTAQLEGSDFTLLNLSTAKATITPDLQLSLAQDALTLQGDVDLPQAYLDIESVMADVAEGGVDVSRDVVVVQADETALIAEQQRALPFNAQLELRLGSDVRISGFGLDAALNGGLSLEQEAGRPLLAYGELGIPEGTYRIYNQELSTRDGRLLFYGNPVSPVLDLRAFRETSTAEVGMQLTGTPDKLQSRLYSTPTLPESEILAILITGKSFNNMNDQDGNALLNAVANFGIERGEGLTSMIGNKLGLDSVAISGGDSYLDSALGVGKYITPDLLMRYEIGLFDRQAVLSIDYSLTEHLKLEVRSGISQSVDVSYTIEKD